MQTIDYWPTFYFLNDTGEALAAVLRPGRVGSNPTAHHIEVLPAELIQIRRSPAPRPPDPDSH
jgi:hypothetical protein